MKKIILSEKVSTRTGLKSRMLHNIKPGSWVLLAFFLCLSSSSLFAQSPYSIKGSVIDTSAAGIKLGNTIIHILNVKDSTLVDFTRTDPNGVFSINNLTQGKFILLITRGGYTDYVDRFSLDSVNKVRDFGKLNLITRARLLAEVVIKNRAAIVVKGDTTEFNAEKYVIPANSKVEDLVRQFPGIEIDKDGNITAMGKKVTKFLVDGEEFFNDDPTLVTRNLRGDMIDKVQLYDRQSDKAMFTGVDDGARTTTMNFVLKEDKRKGYFGKTDLGYAQAITDMYEETAALNAFELKRKFALVGNISTLNRSANAADVSRYGVQGVGLPVGGQNPLSHLAATHYDSKWNGDKESINGNYTYGDVSGHGTRNTITQEQQPQDLFTNNNDITFKNKNNRQTMNATYQILPTTTSQWRIGVNGSSGNSESDNTNLTSRTGSNDLLQLRQNNITSGESKQQSINADIYWIKKLKKPGRNFTLNISQSYSKNIQKGFQNTTIDYYNDPGTSIDSSRYIDQYKPSTGKTYSMDNSFYWTEPLSKTLSMTANYGLRISNNSSENNSYDKNTAGEYAILDQEFSNHFRTDDLSNQAGASFIYKKPKASVNFGTRINALRTNRTDVNTGTQFDRNFISINPTVTYRYMISPQKSFDISYYGTTSTPNLGYLQPVKSNSNPTNITVGNPNLNSSYTNRVTAYYYSSKPLGSQYINISGSYSLIMNNIIQSSIVDAGGNTVRQYQNLTDKMPYIYSLNATYGRTFKKSAIRATLSFTPSGSTSYNFVNGSLNTMQTYTLAGRLSLNKSVAKKYMFGSFVTPDYNISKSSLIPSRNDNYLHWYTNAWIVIYLPGKMELASDVNSHVWGKSNLYSSNALAVWCATIRKKFLKSSNLTISLTANDLLNQGDGLQRNGFSRTINNATVKRYFLTSLIWDFSKFGKSKQPASGPGQQPVPQPRPMPMPQPGIQPPPQN